MNWKSRQLQSNIILEQGHRDRFLWIILAVNLQCLTGSVTCLWTCFHLAIYTSYLNHPRNRRKVPLISYVRNICHGERTNHCGQLQQTTQYAANSHPTAQALLLIPLLNYHSSFLLQEKLTASRQKARSRQAAHRAGQQQWEAPSHTETKQGGGQIQQGNEPTCGKMRQERKLMGRTILFHELDRSLCASSGTIPFSLQAFVTLSGTHQRLSTL